MVRAPAANRLVVWVLRLFLPSGITHRGLENTLILRRRKVLQEDMLDAPKAPRGERRDLWRPVS